MVLKIIIISIVVFIMLTKITSALEVRNEIIVEWPAAGIFCPCPTTPKYYFIADEESPGSCIELHGIVHGGKYTFDVNWRQNDPLGNKWDFGWWGPYTGSAGDEAVVCYWYQWGTGPVLGVYEVFGAVKDNWDDMVDYIEKRSWEFVTEICTNECTSGTTEYRCAPDNPNLRQKRTCGNYDGDPCLEWSSWSNVEDCNSRNYYSTCTWTCLDENTRRCTRSYYNYDCWNGGTSCSVVEVVDGSYSEDCPSGQTCENGQCAGVPTGILELIFLFLKQLAGG